MAEPSERLVWIDLEMTGLDVSRDVIIEIATLVTDNELQVVAEGPSLAIHQHETALQGMDAWNTQHHTASGLVERVRQSQTSVAEAERLTLEFLRQYLPAGDSPMCGNSVCQDRRFLWRYMPELEAYFHYRNLDVSSLKELMRRWAPQLKAGFSKQSAHRAQGDIYESLAELRYYRQHFLKLP